MAAIFRQNESVSLPIQSDIAAVEILLSGSTASLSLTFCLVVCLFFLAWCLQDRYDGDWLGGLLHALLVICATLCSLMSLVRSPAWPRLIVAAVGAFSLWFFHRMAVFPIIALLLPFSSIQAYRVHAHS